ncbi:MAG: hypothetical protein PHU06_12930 [Gallionella sp.]|nr:hypothetical protein [Gallionella sp.]MDD4959662.1 hypothetical protein [Gallionella sp.]
MKLAVNYSPSSLKSYRLNLLLPRHCHRITLGCPALFCVQHRADCFDELATGAVRP